MTQEAVQPAAVRQREMTDEEAASVFDGGDQVPIEDIDPDVDEPPEQVEASDALPDWATELPPKAKVPLGATVAWIRVKKEWTTSPQKGDRVLVVWPLNEMEERQAVARARGDQYMLTNELAKACIRVVDGNLAWVLTVATPAARPAGDVDDAVRHWEGRRRGRPGAGAGAAAPRRW